MQAVEAELARHIPIVREITGKNITLERIAPLMKTLGDPQDQLKVIHIAGTSGKTSTAYYIAGMLQAAGATVGLTVSPHIDSVTERAQVNGRPLDEKTFCRAFGEFMTIADRIEPEPSYFELLVAFAYWYFARSKVDYAVIETGFGGLHDATNIAQQPAKICVITDIGYDHMHILGNTLPEIAAQKAGIIHAGNQAVMYRQPPAVTQIFEERAHAHGADLQLMEQDGLAKTFALPGLDVLPLYQRRNWLLARAAVDVIARRDRLTVPDLTATLQIQVPGRMDEWQAHGKTIVMDGAHNEQKMRAFVSSFTARYPDTKATILLSLKQGKEYEAVLPLLRPVCDRLIITTFNVLQDLPSRSIEPTILRRAAKTHGFTQVSTEEDTATALKTALETSNDLLVITGSFYLLSIVRPLILKS